MFLYCQGDGSAPTSFPEPRKQLYFFPALSGGPCERSRREEWKPRAEQHPQPAAVVGSLSSGGQGQPGGHARARKPNGGGPGVKPARGERGGRSSAPGTPAGQRPPGRERPAAPARPPPGLAFSGNMTAGLGEPGRGRGETGRGRRRGGRQDAKARRGDGC